MGNLDLDTELKHCRVACTQAFSGPFPGVGICCADRAWIASTFTGIGQSKTWANYGIFVKTHWGICRVDTLFGNGLFGRRMDSLP